jgi:predicted secreted protein
LSDGQQFHQYQQKSPLTSTHWVMVNNFTNINKNHLTITQWVEVRGDFCWYWWNCWPSLNELRWEMIFVDIGELLKSTKIISHFNSLSDGQQFHQYQQKSPLSSTHWVMVNNSINISKYHLSPQPIEWWSTIPPISTKKVIFVDIGGIVDITQWVEVRGDFCWYWWNCWPSLNEFRWEMIFVDIGGIVDHHSMSWSERWFIEWWSTIPPISIKITSHLNSLSDGQQFHQCQEQSPLTSTHWEMVN